jgi:thioredoxin reductase/ferredoxin
MSGWIWIVYLIPLLFVWGWQFGRRRRVAVTSRSAHLQAQRSGSTEPVSLHPAISAALCVGCGECIKACPEQPNVLGLIDGKAELVSPGDCIGHGACRTSCPVGAIELVFGTAQRGIDIPVLSPEFETNVPGVYVAGELGGMGLIRNALTQGTQAVRAIGQRGRSRKGVIDVVIIGAGPAGFAASLTAMSMGLTYVTIEQESLGGCVFQYPRAKLIMTSAVDVPLIGKLQLGQTSKEALLEFWRKVEKKTGVAIRYNERVESITSRGRGFVVRTTQREYAASSVVLAIGRRGTPRKLGVPGEDLSKVVYRLVDPEQYTGQNVLVIGGGDSALEAAVSIAEATNAKVAISYRGGSFVRAKARNRERMEAARAEGRLHTLMNSQVREIAADAVVFEQRGKVIRIPNDAVIVAAGGVLPAELLKGVGVQVQTKYGTT